MKNEIEKLSELTRELSDRQLKREMERLEKLKPTTDKYMTHLLDDVCVRAVKALKMGTFQDFPLNEQIIMAKHIFDVKKAHAGFDIALQQNFQLNISDEKINKLLEGLGEQVGIDADIDSSEREDTQFAGSEESS